MKGSMQADHIEPVVPIENDWADDPKAFLKYDWNKFISRLFVEESGFAPLCKACHKAKTKTEAAERAAHKRARKARDAGQGELL